MSDMNEPRLCDGDLRPKRQTEMSQGSVPMLHY